MAETQFYRETARGGAAAVITKQGLQGVYPLGPLARLGRPTPENPCDVPVPSALVSRRHGEIAHMGARWLYRDLGSTNGTRVSGRRLGVLSPEGTAQTELQNGDVLAFRCRGEDPTDGAQDAAVIFSTALSKDDVWETIPLGKVAEITIGRNYGAGIELPDAAVSERHASLFSAGDTWAVIDHGSKNGVFLNGRRLSRPRYLEPLDIVRIADHYFVFLGESLLHVAAGGAETAAPSAPAQSAAPAPAQPAAPAAKRGTDDGALQIHIEKREVAQGFKRYTLLRDIHLTVSRGEMILILGGSGAGKTTFINAVMGYEKADGQILYEDADVYKEYDRMKYEIGFVPQQDLLRGSDSVFHTLANAAEMKLPRSFRGQSREDRIDEVLEQVGLSRERDTLVSKLSGGQRKRLSIAVELIANPSLFFLDEPDSGLDDVMGRGLMENLRAIADSGKIVMVITHSPERASDLFDKLIVLAKSTEDNCGHLAFFGSVQEGFGFFGVRSFREIVQKINRPDENGEGLSDFFIEKFKTHTGGGAPA